MNKLTRMIAIVAMSMAAAPVARAQMLCSEPLVPLCIESPERVAGGSDLALNQCLQDAEEFEQRVTEYVECQLDELEEFEAEADAALRAFRCAVGEAEDSECD